MMPALDTLIVNEHLAVCEDCYYKFQTKTLLASTYDFARTDLKAAEKEALEHLSFDQILAYIDDEIDLVERGIAGVHLETCSECDDVYEDLRKFKSDLAYGKVYAPLPKQQFREKVAVIWEACRLPFKIAAATAAAASLIWFIRTYHQTATQLDDLQQRIAALRTDESALTELKSQLERLSRENRELQSSAKSLKLSGITPNSLIAINDLGGRVVLDDRGEINGVGFASADEQQAVIDALRSGRVKESAELSNLIGEKRRLMGSGNRQSLPIAPVGIVVATTQPTFRWKPVSGAAAYTITIHSNDLRETVTSQALTGTQWTALHLSRDRTYSWQIRAIKGNSEIISPAPDAREARFRILSQAEVDKLERIKATYSKSHLTLGVIYARMGLFSEAEKEFRALLKANPGSNTVKQLLRSVTRGRLK
jgi:tetratricopeptide (TPR) repeat protein